MTGTLWYLRSRRVPLALAVSVGGAAAMWSLWLATADSRDAAMFAVVLTVLLMVTAFTGTLAGSDQELERTASIRWPWRRAVHLTAVLPVVVGVLFATLYTGARFGPAGLVLRDAAGLLGLTALCAAVIGTARAWYLPIAWTITASMFPQTGTWGSVATWQAQVAADNKPAAATAAVLAAAGLITYSLLGPARQEPTEHVR